MQARNPGGYQRHLDNVKAFNESKKKPEPKTESSSKSKDSSDYNTTPYEGSDEYKENEKLIKEAGNYKAKPLNIAKGSDKKWLKNQFKGIDPVGMPRKPSMPKLKKVKGYTGKESWAGPKSKDRFKPDLKSPKRLSSKNLKAKFKPKKK